MSQSTLRVDGRILVVSKSHSRGRQEEVRSFMRQNVSKNNINTVCLDGNPYIMLGDRDDELIDDDEDTRAANIKMNDVLSHLKTVARSHAAHKTSRGFFDYNNYRGLNSNVQDAINALEILTSDGFYAEPVWNVITGVVGPTTVEVYLNTNQVYTDAHLYWILSRFVNMERLDLSMYDGDFLDRGDVDFFDMNCDEYCHVSKIVALIRGVAANGAGNKLHTLQLPHLEERLDVEDVATNTLGSALLLLPNLRKLLCECHALLELPVLELTELHVAGSNDYGFTLSSHGFLDKLLRALPKLKALVWYNPIHGEDKIEDIERLCARAALFCPQMKEVIVTRMTRHRHMRLRRSNLGMYMTTRAVRHRLSIAAIMMAGPTSQISVLPAEVIKTVSMAVGLKVGLTVAS